MAAMHLELTCKCFSAVLVLCTGGYSGAFCWCSVLVSGMRWALTTDRGTFPAWGCSICHSAQEAGKLRQEAEPYH